MNEWIQSMVFDAMKDWFFSGGWRTVTLCLGAVLVIWTGIKFVAKKFMMPILITGVAMAFAAVLFWPTPPSTQAPVVVQRPIVLPELPSIKLPELPKIEFPSLPSGPSAVELAIRRAEAEAALARARADEERLRLARDEEEKKRQAEEAKRQKELAAWQRKMAWRIRNAQARAMMDQYIVQGIAEAEAQNARQMQQQMQRAMQMLQPPPPVVLPPGSTLHRGK
jgi:hypothetical protein